MPPACPLCSKQLRTRDCEDCAVHLYTKTDPIIEKSWGMVFSAFDGACPRLDKLFVAANLPAQHNHWRRVFDFSKDDASLPKPHWTLTGERSVTVRGARGTVAALVACMMAAH